MTNEQLKKILTQRAYPVANRSGGPEEWGVSRFTYIASQFNAALLADTVLPLTDDTISFLAQVSVKATVQLIKEMQKEVDGLVVEEEESKSEEEANV